jgi:uncharacterized protein YjeT (DUF2065 family)
MKVGISVAFVCIGIGVFYLIVPDFLKYGWRRNRPEQLKYLATESYKKYMRRSGIVIIIIGVVIFCITLIKYFF